MAIKYKDFEKREQLRKDYIDKAAEAAKTQANAYTDEQIRNIPAPPAPDIPTALPQKYEAFKVQLVQGNISEGENPTWSEYHEILWNGSGVLTNSSETLANKAHFVTDTVLYWRSPRKYNLLITINGTEKEFVFEGEHSQYGTNWVIWQLKENDVVVAEAECIGRGNGQYYNNTSTVYVYCPDGSPYIGQTMTSARYGKKQYLYSLTNPAAILQYPSETENTRFLTMCKSIATKNAKLKLTLTDNVVEANYANISNELVTTDYVGVDYRIRWIGIVADRVPNKANGTDINDDMPTCIKGVLEVEYTDEEATKECVYDKIQGESYTFKIGDFNHEESSAFDYYFNGAILIPFSNAQIQASFTYRPVSGTEKSVQVKSMVNDGQMLPYFDISELFGQAANTVMAVITSNTAVENVDMGGRPVTTISLTSNIQNFTDANDEIMVGGILTLTSTSLPQTYKKKAVTLTTSGWETITLNKFGSYSGSVSKFSSKNVETTGLQITKNTSVFIMSSFEPSIMHTMHYYGESDYTWYWDYSYSSAQYIKLAVSKTSGAATFEPNFTADSFTVEFFANVGPASAYIYNLTDADVKVNSEVRFTLDEANGKLAGQFGLKKTINKEAGKLTFTADTLPTSAITGTLEIGETSTEGTAFVEGIIEPSTLPATVAKTDVENTFTKTQTFNGTESQAGIKTNAIDNESGNRVVYFNGTKQMFGSGDIPTQVRSSEQRLKLERPVSGGTGTEIVEIANLSDAVSGSITKLVELTWSTYDDEISFSFSDTSKNYALNDGNVIPFATAESTNSRLRLDIGKTYAIVYNGTTYTAVAQKNVLGTHTSSKLEFTIGDKTLVLMDMATVSSNVSADNLPKYKNKTAIAYFSDYSTPTQGTSFVLKTIPWAYTTVIPYDDNFTQTADITISAALRNVTDVDPLYISPTVVRSSDGINIWVPVFNTVQYGLDEATGQPQIVTFETKICPTKLLLILNSPTGSVVRLNGFSNRYRVGGGYGIILSTSAWSQSGTKYVGHVSGLLTNRFTDLEMIFESNEDSDRYYSANVRVKKSADWLTGTTTSDVTEFIADSIPEGQIRAYVYPIVSY